MRLASMILGSCLFIGLATQSIVVTGISAFDDDLDPGLPFVEVMLLALVIAVAFTHGVPMIGAIAFGIAGLAGVVGGATSDYRDLYVWGAGSLLVSVVACGGVRERGKLLEEARTQSSQLQSLVTAVSALAASSPGRVPTPLTQPTVASQLASSASPSLAPAAATTPTPATIANPAPKSPVPFTGPASLSLSHSSAFPGAVVGAMIHGFDAGLPVALGWRTASGAVQTLGSAVISDAGWTHLSFTIPVDTLPGDFMVIAATTRDQVSRMIRVSVDSRASSQAA